MAISEKRESRTPRLLLAGLLCLSLGAPILLAGCAETKTYYEGLGEAKDTADEVKEQADKAVEDLEKMTQELSAV